MLINNFQLKELNTFGLPSVAREFFSFSSEEELVGIINDGYMEGKSTLVLGGGSNILFTSNYDGLVIHPDIGNIEIEERTNSSVLVSAGAGVIWDDFVEWCVLHDLSGAENLSLIPGMVGASPVQNIGAYGVEAEDIIERVRFITLSDGRVNEIDGRDCRFGYRDSIFKHEFKGKIVVTKVWYRLSVEPILNTSYGDVARETEVLGGINLRNIRQAIINIRRRKLPDPEETGNAGSFFKNPVIPNEALVSLLAKYPDMPHYDMPGGDAKLAAGWLIERCGWKGYRKGKVGVHDKQALVLVNYGGAAGKEISSLAADIRISVREKFEIDLCPEVEII